MVLHKIEVNELFKLKSSKLNRQIISNTNQNRSTSNPKCVYEMQIENVLETHFKK